MAQGSKDTETGAFVDGSILPPEILDIILDKLFFVSDYARFSSVCKSWNAVAVNYQKQKRIAAVHEQPPMLLFLKSADYSRYLGFFELGCLENLFSFGEERLYERGFRFDQWISNHKVICLGSSYGWLALESSTSNIMLINPFIRKVIKIPRIPSRDALKIVLSCDPSKHPDELVIAAVTSGDGETALITLGQQRWTIVSNLYLWRGADLVFHKGLLYVVNVGGHIYAIDYKHDRPVRKFYVEEYVQTWDNHRIASRYFLVEACNGDLVLVLCCLPSYLRDPWKFIIYKLQCVRGEEEFHWEGTKMSKIDDAIFLSDNSSLCIPAAAASGSSTNPNSIYFSFNFSDKRYPEHFRFRERQTGVYNLEDGTLKDLLGLPNEGHFSPIALLSPYIEEARADCAKPKKYVETKDEIEQGITGGKDKEEFQGMGKVNKDKERWVEVKGRREKKKKELIAGKDKEDNGHGEGF